MRAAIVLAAGRSRRFGNRDKLLTRYRGKPLLLHAIEAARRAPVGRVIVVTGTADRRVHALVRSLRDTRILVRQTGGRKRRASLLAGLQSLRCVESEVIVFLGDMPDIPKALTFRLVRRGRGSAAVRPSHRTRPGHPVLLRDAAKARQRLEQDDPPFTSEELATFAADSAAVRDIDRPGELARRLS